MIGRRFFIVFSCFFLFTHLFISDAESGPAGKSVASDLTIKAGKWAVGRLRNMPDMVELKISVESEGKIVFFLLTEEELKIFPKIEDPIIMTRVERTFSATTFLSKGGNYYLLFWNKYSDKSIDARFFSRVTPLSAARDSNSLSL